MLLEKRPEVRFLSQLYAADEPDSVMLVEYPSSNSDHARFQNRDRFIIHDPFPPPRPELLKVLGPHHLMCGWGNDVKVCSELRPPETLIQHWQRIFGLEGCPAWQAFDPSDRYHVLFPHEAIAAQQQVVDPVANYALHSKEVIQQIDCPQALVLNAITPPCIVKLSHGYAGLGNYFIRQPADEASMHEQLNRHWPNATLVINSIIENVCGDYGVQFYLHKDGSMVWLGVTEQHFNSNLKWSGGSFSAELQDQLYKAAGGIIEATGQHLHKAGYVGLVGIDILKDSDGHHYLVDVNPRLTGISPFLMMSRIFAEQGLGYGIYRASVRVKGSLQQLIETAEATHNGRVVVLSAFEEQSGDFTICHLSANAESLQMCDDLLDQISIS